MAAFPHTLAPNQGVMVQVTFMVKKHSLPVRSTPVAPPAPNSGHEMEYSALKSDIVPLK